MAGKRSFVPRIEKRNLDTGEILHVTRYKGQPVFDGVAAINPSAVAKAIPFRLA
jgi:hypothetical protein